MAITLDGTNGIDSPDLNITGTGARITGDFSTVPLANRVAFQTSTVNGQTDVQAIPNGTGTRAGFIAYNNSDVASATANTQLLQLSTETRLVAGGSSPLPMTFYAGGSERLRILTTGGITFNGDTAAANALDEYEEGTFTPALEIGASTSGITYSEQLGLYVKIGTFCYVQITISLSSKGSNSGVLTFNNLPFLSSNTTGSRGGGTVAFFGAMAGVNGVPAVYGEQGTYRTGLYDAGNNIAALSQMDNTNLTDSTYLRLTYVYQTNS